MSYVQSVIQCGDCGKKMNVAFGIQGMTQIAVWPEECPDCHSKGLKQLHYGWDDTLDRGLDKDIPKE